MYFLYPQRLRTSVSFVVSNFGLTFALRLGTIQTAFGSSLGLVVNHHLSNSEVCSGTIKNSALSRARASDILCP